MISVEEALTHVLALASPIKAEEVALRYAAGRVLAKPAVARRNQPPFRASIMDGYAVRGEHQSYRVTGEIAAGDTPSNELNDGEAVRIFTGAPLPEGASRVIIQEDTAVDGDRITIRENADKSTYIREEGRDFKAGFAIDSGQRLTPARIALAASMNVPTLSVARRPRVAIIPTGNELVMPGESPSEAQIIASNAFGLVAIAEQEGAEARLLPIARDTVDSLKTVFALASDADLIVTIGGASVGDYDLVGSVTEELGLERAFYKIAMRPGKPLMAGRLGAASLLGLPGNPVSALVCGHVFLRPLLRKMQGMDDLNDMPETAPLAEAIGKNGPRQHYMRATLNDHKLRVATHQDSALLTVLANANALVIRAPHDPEKAVDDLVSFIKI
ncbi:MAG: gephyrin-like molybdotransferase Glp [Pseudomonadota bacterium]